MTDRFDRAPRLGRVGVHRAPERRVWRWWMTLVCAIAACGLLVLGGVAAVRLLDVDEVPIPSAVATPANTDPAALPAGTTITVLDASGADAGATVAETLAAGGWPVAAQADASAEVAETVVYYQGDLEANALGIAEVVGAARAEQTGEVLSGSPITVVVGSSGLTASPSTAP